MHKLLAGIWTRIDPDNVPKKLNQFNNEVMNFGLSEDLGGYNITLPEDNVWGGIDGSKFTAEMIYDDWRPIANVYISDNNVVKQLRSQLEFESYYYSNLRWQYTDEYWEDNKQFFFLNDFNERIRHKEPKGDNIVSFKYSDLIKDFENNRNILVNIQDLIHTTDIGDYEYGIFNFSINEKNNLQNQKSTFDYKKVLTGDFKFN